MNSLYRPHRVMYPTPICETTHLAANLPASYIRVLWYPRRKRFLKMTDFGQQLVTAPYQLTWSAFATYHLLPISLLDCTPEIFLANFHGQRFRRSVGRLFNIFFFSKILQPSLSPSPSKELASVFWILQLCLQTCILKWVFSPIFWVCLVVVVSLVVFSTRLKVLGFLECDNILRHQPSSLTKLGSRLKIHLAERFSLRFGLLYTTSSIPVLQSTSSMRYESRVCRWTLLRRKAAILSVAIKPRYHRLAGNPPMLCLRPFYWG